MKAYKSMISFITLFPLWILDYILIATIMFSWRLEYKQKCFWTSDAINIERFFSLIQGVMSLLPVFLNNPTLHFIPLVNNIYVICPWQIGL